LDGHLQQKLNYQRKTAHLGDFMNVEFPKRDGFPYVLFNGLISYLKCFKEEMECLLLINYF
jgi:hypothetical protein